MGEIIATRLPSLKCPSCHREMAELPLAGGTATCFEECRRRCVECNIGASNAIDPASVTYIYADPIESIPQESRDGAKETLCRALNVRNQPSKWKKFGFVPTSEDAVTWVVFTYLLRAGKLQGALQRVGLVDLGISPPASLLLWGVPIGIDVRANQLREELHRLCVRLGESDNSCSEPDVMIDIGEGGLIFIEVKLRSGNDLKRGDYPGWNKYLSPSNLSWNMKAVRASGCYELARNWRLMTELAGIRPATLVNLGPPALWRGESGVRVEEFVAALNLGEGRRFERLPWESLMEEVLSDTPEWFKDFCAERVGDVDFGANGRRRR